MKRRYVRPVLQKVKLVSSEAVLRSCKNTASAGPQGTACYVVGADSCSVIGS